MNVWTFLYIHSKQMALHLVPNYSYGTNTRTSRAQLSKLPKHNIVTRWDKVINPRRAGVLCFPCRAGGGGVFTPPSYSAPGNIATRCKRQSKQRKKITDRLQSIFRSAQMSGHQRSSKVKFCRFQHLSTNQRLTREPEELQHREKAHSIALYALSLMWLQIWPKINGWPPESKKSKNSRFCEKVCFCNNYWFS